MEASRAAARHAVVVGGGITGLAAALRLAGQPGVRVTLLEAAPAVGGKLRLGQVGGVTLDVGAEAVLARRPEAVQLIRAAGLGDDLVHPATTRASVLSRGVLHPLPAGTLMGVPGDPSALRGVLTDAEVARAGAEPAGRPLPEDDVDVASWVTARVGRAVVDRLVEPLLGGVYAGTADRLSLRATIPQLWDVARRGSELLPAVRALLPVPGSDSAAGRAPGPPAAPVFAGIRGGVGRLPDALADRLAAAGVDVRTSVSVRGLRRTPDGWALTVGSAADPAEVTADVVLLAVPPPAARRLLAEVSPVASAEYAGIELASVVLVTALVPARTLAGHPGSGLLVPPVEGRAVKASTFSSNKWAWTADAVRATGAGGEPDAGGRLDADGELAVVRLSLGRAGESRVLQLADAELTALATADLAGILGRPVVPVASAVTRWGGGLPQYAVGHVDRVARIRRAVAAAGPGLAVAGAALDGVGVPACIASADRAVDEVSGHLARQHPETAGRMRA